MARLPKIVALLAPFLLTACQALSGTRALDTAIADPKTNRVPITRLDTGLLSVPLTFADGTSAPFILDTGATMSVLFADRSNQIGTVTQESVRIHGMFDSRLAGLTTLPDVSIGRQTLGDVRMAILPPRKLSPTPAWGIIGMDLLERFRLFRPKDEDTLFLFPVTDAPVDLPPHWATIELSPNPYAQTDSARRLRFMNVRLAGRLAPALLDTGLSFSLMSYHFATLPQLKHHRQQHKRRFRIEGALDTYRPKLRVSNISFRAGTRHWKSQSFVVQDIESLGILGLEDRPFLIAGINLFADESFYLDVSENVLRMPQSTKIAGKRSAKP